MDKSEDVTRSMITDILAFKALYLFLVGGGFFGGERGIVCNEFCLITKANISLIHYLRTPFFSLQHRHVGE